MTRGRTKKVTVPNNKKAVDSVNKKVQREQDKLHKAVNTSLTTYNK